MAKEMLELDLVEASALQESISRVENALFYGGLDGEALALMRRFLENAKSRLGRIEEKEAEHEKKANEDELAAEVTLGVAIAKMVEHEAALNREEKAEYGSLLRHEFFTKSMFGQLEQFYSRSYDKLSEGGKAEMSHRVWEGIRHEEYKFSDLPAAVKEREAERAESLLRSPGAVSTDIEGIPAVDKADFLRARSRGEREEVYSIMSRPSFAEHLGKLRAKNALQGAMVDNEAIIRETENHKLPQPALEQVAVHVNMDSKKESLLDKEPAPVAADTSLGGFDLADGVMQKLRAAQGESSVEADGAGSKAQARATPRK